MVKYNWEDESQNRCSRCGKTKNELKSNPPIPTGINHPDYAYAKADSFYIYGAANAGDEATQILCAACHREHELEQCFKAMDRYAEKNGEDALAKVCGIGVKNV